jgi:tetratricopeptide (TPR) repeat protein/HEAT repeat protein
VTLALAVLAGPARGDDFDPNGRHRHPTSSPTRPRPASSAPAAHPAPEATATPALIERYTRIVLSQPGAAFPLQRLAQLYRERDGSLKALATDLQSRPVKTAAEQYAVTIALAGVAKLEGRLDDAIGTYQKAIALAPSDPAALLALAHAYEDRGDLRAASARYEQALALESAPSDRELTTRTLMKLALDSKDWDAAKNWHAQLIKAQPSSLFVRGELARELMTRGEYALAETELLDLVNASQGDNRALAPALKDLAKAEAMQHKNVEALARLKRALSVAGAEAGVRGEIYQAMTELYRSEQRLPEWVKVLEDEHPSDFLRLALLGSLYEETGDQPKALETYKRALAINPRQIDLRLKMIRLLQSQGELDQAIAEYDGLIRSAPNNPQFVFEECEALLQRGDRARALKLLTALEARVGTDDDVLSRVADFYQRIGESERSLKVLTRLATGDVSDPSHLVDLGDRYFQDGNTPLALATWKKILVLVQPRGRALSILGDVYLEHDMTADALAALREAMSLDREDVSVKKQLAGALERARSYREAGDTWAELAAKAKASGDKALAREARSHIVALWGLGRALEGHVAPLSAAFNGAPPDVDAGRTLAEVQLHLRRFADAEATLRRLLELAPGDADSYLALERVLVSEGKIEQAIAALEKLVVVEPKRARETYQRMAQYAQQIYKDKDAIRYAQLAVAQNPDDADGHYRLGKMYGQDTESAIREFRAAIQKNDRLYAAYFDLTDLLLSRGETDEADRLFRRVVRGAPDEELITRAARLSIQINLEKGTLESFEQELLPLAIGNPQRPIYRRLLVEAYGDLTFGLVQRVKRDSGKDSDEARAALARIGARAVKPLLDALADADPSQQRIAIDVLGFVRNKNAGSALFAFAIGNADTALRVRAMVACGALRDSALLPKYQALLAREEDAASDGVAVAAIWGLARMEDKRALPLLRAMVRRGSPQARAIAVLGVGAQRDRAGGAAVADLAKESGAGNAARAAAAYVLGEIGGEGDRATLLALAEGTDPLSREMALLALARMPPSHDTPSERATIAAMADAVFAAGDPESPRAQAAAEAVRRAGCAALVMMNKRPATAIDPLAAVEDSVDVEALIARLVPASLPAEDRLAALVAFSGAIKQAASVALTTSGDRARAVFDAVEVDGTLLPFVTSDASAAAHETARGIASELEPKLIAFAGDQTNPAVRARVTLLLARSASPAATAAVIRSLGDPDESVQRTALSAIDKPDPNAVAAVARVLATHKSWAMRELAVQAMGRLGAAGARAAAADSLRAAATTDAYALVREAALVALASFDADAGRALARKLVSTDPEPRVVETARKISAP